MNATASNIFDLSGKIALVTGSSRGIGNILATALQDAGATVILNAREPGRLEVAGAALAARGGQPVATYAFDVTDEDAVRDAVAAITAEVGPINILVNNAGIQHREPLVDIAVADWERVISTNLTSAFIVGREVARGMVQRGSGKVINVASVQSELARPGIGAYTASKGGVRNLTRAMAAEWSSAGVQVNAIAPGYIHTEMTQALVDDAAFNEFIVARTPAARWGNAEDLAGPVVWLSSRGADFVTGQTIYIDGGMTVVV